MNGSSNHRRFWAIIIVLTSALFWICSDNKSDHFRFVFMTDIHLETGKHAVEGFQAAIDKANSLKPDFVITGGDLVADAMNQTEGRSDSLYTLYLETIKRFTMPVYNAIGNHEHFGIESRGRISADHPGYGKKMFEHRFNQESPFRSFDHGSWHFILLDVIESLPGGTGYTGRMDSVQMAWLEQDLKNVGTERPVVLVTHIPLYSVFKQFTDGSLAANEGWLVNSNSAEVLKILNPYNVQLVLQGHLHILEEIVFRNTHFITAGAVSAAWWTGPHHGFPEGFLVVDVKGNEFTSRYETFGWQATP